MISHIMPVRAKDERYYQDTNITIHDGLSSRKLCNHLSFWSSMELPFPLVAKDDPERLLLDELASSSGAINNIPLDAGRLKLHVENRGAVHR